MLFGFCFPLLSFLSVELLAKAIRSANKFQNRRSMGEPIKQCSGHTLIAAHDTAPLSKTEVGRDDECHPLIEGRAELKQELRSDRGERDKAQLVQDNQLLLAQARHQTRQLVLLLGFNEIVDQSGNIVEAHPSPLSTGCQSEPGGHMTFSEAWITDQDHWLAAFDIGPGSQLQDTRLRNGRDTTPVKLRQIFEDRKACFPDRSFDPLSFAVGHFFLDQSQQIPFITQIGSRRLPPPTIGKTAQNGTSVSP